MLPRWVSAIWHRASQRPSEGVVTTDYEFTFARVVYSVVGGDTRHVYYATLRDGYQKPFGNRTHLAVV